MPTWRKVSECMPENGQSCLLIPRGSNFGQLTIHGPIPWNESGKCWLDLFATPEAGEFIGVKQVAYWCDARDVLPEDLEEVPWEQP